MDFRTEWSSWVLVALMMVISYFINPFQANEIQMILAQVVGLPLITIAIACIPVLIYCYFANVIPDIDYSIRVAFLYFLFILIKNFI